MPWYAEAKTNQVAQDRIGAVKNFGKPNQTESRFGKFRIGGDHFYLVHRLSQISVGMGSTNVFGSEEFKK